jgi:dienelactone hydrolase/type II secretory pathway pseudopilin PulG
VGSVQFFADDDMDFALRCVLSGVRHGMAEVGETLLAAGEVHDGDPDSWLAAFTALGRRLRRTAEQASARGHRFSAWNAALRAANYLYAGTWWAPATGSADRRIELWREHRSAWDLAVEHWPSPVRPVSIDGADDRSTAWWFHSGAASPNASAVVLVGGLGTPVSDLCMTGLLGALWRGHHVLVVEGPGQGEVLYDRGITLDGTWPELLGAAVATAARQPGVDPHRVGLVGVGAGALFAAGAAARERPVDEVAPAVLVLDPPVVDLGADAAASVAGADARGRRLLAWTTTDPTGTDGLDDAVAALSAHRLDDQLLARITCPTLVLTADQAWGFRGQATTVLDALQAPHEHVELTAAIGAGADNGLGAPQVHDAAVFDFWDATLCDAEAGSSPSTTDGADHDR